jgi:hypothetical protein
MTERQGAFTVSTVLFLTPERRARLERLVREQRIDLADLVSMIVADHIETLGEFGTIDRHGAMSVPTRLFLTPEARAHLEQLTHEHALDLADLVSQVLGAYLDTLPDSPPEPAPDHTAELRQRRGELGRLRARRDAAGGTAPSWLNGYIAELEAEIRRLES